MHRYKGRIAATALTCLMTLALAVPAEARFRAPLLGPGLAPVANSPLDQAVTADESIVDLALATPSLSTLVDAVLKAGLAETLDEGGDWTVFAPTNDAFAAAGIDPDAVDEETLTAVLLDHVVYGDLSQIYLRFEARAGDRVPTVGGLQLSVADRPLTVNGIEVISDRIKASNGSVFLIDGVLLDDTAPTIVDLAIATPALSTLVTAVVNADLVETLSGPGPFTVFAPTNEAFENAGVDPDNIDVETLTAVLLDHVVAAEYTSKDLLQLDIFGSELQALGGLELDFNARRRQVNGIRLVIRDIVASNGVVFVIDDILFE